MTLVPGKAKIPPLGKSPFPPVSAPGRWSELDAGSQGKDRSWALLTSRMMGGLQPHRPLEESTLFALPAATLPLHPQALRLDISPLQPSSQHAPPARRPVPAVRSEPRAALPGLTLPPRVGAGVAVRHRRASRGHECAGEDGSEGTVGAPAGWGQPGARCSWQRRAGLAASSFASALGIGRSKPSEEAALLPGAAACPCSRLHPCPVPAVCQQPAAVSAAGLLVHLAAGMCQ